tara:strand:- start:156 stop:524 length:369 start_codon:yes stop_codon:yes gene_type:complete
MSNMIVRMKVEKEIEKFIIKNKKENVLHMTEFDDYVSSISSLPEDNLCTSDEVLLKTTLFGLFFKYKDYKEEKKSKENVKKDEIKRPRTTSPIYNNNNIFKPIKPFPNEKRPISVYFGKKKS